MDTARRVVHYLRSLEWTERVQDICIFCDKANFQTILFEDDQVIAFDTRAPAGDFHWLIIPKLHVARDIESLDSRHLDLLLRMDAAKQHLLSTKCPGAPPSAVHAGYHRGRRPLVGSIYYPDVVSIHHLHLHVIVKPRPVLLLFKYPFWLPLMWKSDDEVLQRARGVNRRRPWLPLFLGTALSWLIWQSLCKASLLLSVAGSF